MPARKIRKDDDVKFSFRIPRSLRDWLEIESQREGRSVNAHLLRLLQDIKEKQAQRTSAKTLPYTDEPT